MLSCLIISLFLYYCRYIVQCAIKSVMASLTEDYLLVAAIDFGTTYSGYALSSIDSRKSSMECRKSEIFLSKDTNMFTS